jgi:hypothetical protein
MLTSGLLASLLCLVPITIAIPARKPWEVSQLTTFSPSGRPGSSPWSIINITISDPNDDSVSPATCVGKWTFEEPPYGVVNNCSDVPGGNWTFAMLKSDNATTASPTTDFKVRFWLKKGKAVFVGTQKFVVGENMSGLCSASGVCGFELKAGMTPVLVKQERVY